MSITSYAQNFEDVMLWRALGHIERGSYIDIGAQDPIIDSVSLAFYERGWHGLHVEPTSRYAELLRQHRTGDTIIQAAVGNTTGILRFFEIPGTGISTADADIAAEHREHGFDVHEISVPCITMSDVFEAFPGAEIHWLKIDVEGFERQVLSGWGASSERPWIVVVESTRPLTRIQTHESWETMLVSYGYTRVYFDGLNRYYVSDAHPEIKDAFLAPPNVFDEFTLNGTSSSSFHRLIEARYQEKSNEMLARMEGERRLANDEIEALRLSLDSLVRMRAEHEESWIKREQEAAAEILSIRQQMARELAEQERNQLEFERELHRQHAEREHALSQQLFAGREELRFLQEDRTRREHVLLQQAGEVRQQLENILRAVALREQGVAEQLLGIQQEAVREQIALTRAHSVQERTLRHQYAERERLLNLQLHAKEGELRRLEEDRAQREREHAERISDSQQALEILLRGQAQREQEVAAQLFAMQQKAGGERAELERSHSEQEQILKRQHVAQAQESKAKFDAKLDEYSHLAAVNAALETQLRAELLLERQSSAQLRHTLAHVQESLETTRGTLSWRMTEPLRKLGSMAVFRKNRGAAPSTGVATDGVAGTATAQLQSADVQQSPVLANAPATMGVAYSSHIRPQEAEGEETPQTVKQFNSGSPAINVRHAFIESTMLSPTQATRSPLPVIASTLDELLGCQDEHFVRCAYLTILGRTADPEGLRYYLSRLRAGFSKIRILEQLSRSSEARARASNLPGLDASIRRYRRGQYPLVGFLFRLTSDVEDDGPQARTLRGIENQLSCLGDESKRRHEHLEVMVARLHELVAAQAQSFIVDMTDAPLAISDASGILADSSEPDDLKQLSPSATAIYYRLRSAAKQSELSSR